MEWVTIQLSSFSKKKLSSAELEKAAKKRVVHPELQIYYPVIEDNYGKQESPYSEYLFISYHEDLDYPSLEELDEFFLVLKSPLGDIKLVPDLEIQKIRQQVSVLGTLKVEDVVQIMEGPLRGSFGVVTGTWSEEATLSVTMGSEIIQASISISHLRFSKKRTVIRRSKLEQKNDLLETLQRGVNSFDKTPQEPKFQIQVEKTVEVDNPSDPDTQIQRIIRRGLKNTRVLVGNQSILLTNTELNRRLAGSDPVPED